MVAEIEVHMVTLATLNISYLLVLVTLACTYHIEGYFGWVFIFGYFKEAYFVKIYS